MNQKRLVWILILFASVSALAQEQSRSLATATFEVVTDTGDAVEDATIALSTFHHWESGEGFGKDVNQTVTGNTDKEGKVQLSIPSLNGEIAYRAYDAPDFYRDQGMNFRFKENLADQWQPDDSTLRIIFKPVLNPVAMFAKTVATTISRVGEPFGYDLQAADWVAPHGKGATTDLIFQLDGYWRSYNDYDSTLSVTFTNPLDGIQSFEALPAHKGSEFRSPRKAPEQGYRVQEVVRRARSTGQDSSEWIDEASPSTNYFYRVRTVVDEKGNITSALYGKIYGGFEFAGASSEGSFLKFIYYLNPTPNERNMEFDPEQNLFGGLPSNEKVIQP